MILNSPIISGSLTVTGNIITSGSITLSGSVASASYAASATSASYALNATSASYALNATTASYAVNATTASYADALTVAGTLTAQTLVVQTITSSVDYVTGSTQFGSISANTHQFTGSVLVSGSINIGTSSSVTNVALNIQSLANSAGIVINNSNASAYTGFRIYNDQVSAVRALEIDYAGSTYGSALVSGGIIGESAVITTTGAYPLQFGTSNTFRAVILANGNLGIGTTSPANKLTISNNGNSAVAFRINDTNANGSFLSLNASNSDSAILAGGTSAIPFDIYTSGSVRMRIETDGSMGFNNSIVGSRSFVFRAITSRPIVIEAIENAGVHSMFFRPNNSGYNLISSNYLSGGTYLPLSLSARESNNDFVLSPAGILTTPSQVSFKAYLSANVNPSKGTNITIPYNVEEYDNQGNYSTSTYKFTAPVAGKYLFTVNFNAYSLDDTAYLRVMLLINASSVRTLFLLQNMPTGNTGDINVSGADILNLSVGTTVEVRVYTDGSGTFGLSQALDWNSFSGHLLG